MEFDRTTEDLGNIVALEHVNVTVPDQEQATIFYIAGLGLTRDPFLMIGPTNMWVNVGRSQFHLPTSSAQVLRGHTGILVPDREALVRRLKRTRKRLEGTRFDFREHEEFVEATCPWGNRIRCYSPDERFGRITLGIAYVEFDVPKGATNGIARFYRNVMGARAAASGEAAGNKTAKDDSGSIRAARVEVGI